MTFDVILISTNKGPAMSTRVELDVLQRASNSLTLETELKRRVIGQDKAVEDIVHTFERQMAGLHRPRRPLGTMLLLGPTGVGKTRIAEALAEVLFGNPDALTKIDCAELQENQSIMKILGSSPGYIGYADKEDGMYLSQSKLDIHQTTTWPINILVLDEVEKAHENLFRLFLGILDKGTLSLNNGRKIDFSKTIIIMTSNLGAEDVSRYVNNSLGFSVGPKSTDANVALGITSKALKNKFSPEFINRIDQIIHFNALKSNHMEQILDIECNSIQKRILTSDTVHPFSFTLDLSARTYLLDKGTSKEYGARELNRVLDREVVTKLSNLILTNQIEIGDEINISYSDGDLIFGKSMILDTHEDISENFCTAP